MIQLQIDWILSVACTQSKMFNVRTYTKDGKNIDNNKFKRVSLTMNRRMNGWMGGLMHGQI